MQNDFILLVTAKEHLSKEQPIEEQPTEEQPIEEQPLAELVAKSHPQV